MCITQCAEAVRNFYIADKIQIRVKDSLITVFQKLAFQLDSWLGILQQNDEKHLTSRVSLKLAYHSELYDTEHS